MVWNLETILTIVMGVAFAISVIVDVVYRVKNGKSEDIKTTVLDAMMYVENNLSKSFGKLPSEAKLILAKSLIMLECRTRGIKYDDEKYEGMIETLIDFSKHINYNNEKENEENVQDD